MARCSSAANLLKPQRPRGAHGGARAPTPPNFLHLFCSSYLGEVGCCYVFSSASI